jgi:DNA-binding LytR/AlgR family response regulator
VAVIFGRTLRALIVDDESVARRVLREGLEACHVESIDEAENGRAALELIEANRPDVVFVDLQMPLMSGFETIGRLRGPQIPAIVIVTAYDSYAVQAFEAGAIDYLLKPVRLERLQQSLDRAAGLIKSPRELAEEALRIQDVALRQPGAPRVRKMVGKAGGEYFLLNISDVLAFQADGDLTWICTAHRRYLSTRNLKLLQEELHGAGFRRVHRNALVNIDAVKKMSIITSQRWMITLTNGQEFIVSKRQAGTIRDVLR